MKFAKNIKGEMVNIIESSSNEIYYCPICKEKLTRNFGVQNQFYSHPKGEGEECELKVKLLLKEDGRELTIEEKDILKEEYYEKEFPNVEVEMSDYISEEGYKLTKEQTDIIYSKEDKIKVSALAGSSKSTTLYYYAKQRPFKKILYVVYNKAMKDEAMKSFGKLRHVEVKTMHGLAYKYVGVYYKDKLTLNYGAVDIIKDLNLDWYRDQELAIKVDTMMKEYMLSDVCTFEELEIFENDDMRNQIINTCERLWELKKSYHSRVKIEHDFYLKLFQLSKKDLNSAYDIILLDEAQDSSKLFLDVIINSNIKGIVIVGDPFQALYGWRKSINIMNLFEAKEYKLTTSFRVNQNIANISNLIIQDVNNTNINMKGFNTKQRIVDRIDRTNLYTCLCRTNAYMFSNVIEAIESGKKRLYFEGGYSGYNFENIKDAYYFSVGHETKNPLFSKFKSYFQMEEYVDATGDLELKAILRMIREYGSTIPSLIDSIKRNTISNKDNADVIFSTVHRAKGQTYQNVLLSDDHFDIEELFLKKYVTHEEIEKDFYEEMCIIYVAITRVSGDIELSDKLKRYLITRYEFYNEI